MNLLIELRETISDGRALLKDIKQERKLLLEAVDRIPSSVDGAVQERIDQNMAQMSELMKGAMDDAVNQIDGIFERLRATLTLADKKSRRQGLPSVEDLIVAAEYEAARRQAESPHILKAAKAAKAMKKPRDCGHEH